MGELWLVELVQGLAPPGHLAYSRVDLTRLQAVGNHAARQARDPQNLRRVVALVGDGYHLVTEAECEQGLRRRGDEAGDSHASTMAGLGA